MLRTFSRFLDGCAEEKRRDISYRLLTVILESQEEAKLFAEAALGKVSFFREDPCCWTFGASSAQLIGEERIPGMIFASVDKLDGHIWTREELERFSEEN